jgi:hypothetical protein
MAHTGLEPFLQPERGTAQGPLGQWRTSHHRPHDLEVHPTRQLDHDPLCAASKSHFLLLSTFAYCLRARTTRSLTAIAREFKPSRVGARGQAARGGSTGTSRVRCGVVRVRARALVRARRVRAARGPSALAVPQLRPRQLRAGTAGVVHGCERMDVGVSRPDAVNIARARVRSTAWALPARPPLAHAVGAACAWARALAVSVPRAGDPARVLGASVAGADADAADAGRVHVVDEGRMLPAPFPSTPPAAAAWAPTPFAGARPPPSPPPSPLRPSHLSPNMYSSLYR